MKEAGLEARFKKERANLKNLEGDSEYKEFCVKSLILREELQKQFKLKPKLNTRQIDDLLISMANEKLRTL